MSLPDRLSLVDASFLYSETRNVSMNVGALLILNPATAPSGTVSRSDLIELLSNRIHQIPRLRQKLAFPPFGLARPVWVDDPSFRVEQHVYESSIPEPGSYRDLLNHVQEIHAQHFDRGHPLWQLHLITGLRRGRMAVVLRLHHAFVDGVSALEILNMLLDRTRHAQPLDPRPWRPASEPSSKQLLSDAFAEGMAEPFLSAVSVASTLSKPNRLIDGVGVILRESLEMLAAGPLPDSPFNVPVGPRRRLQSPAFPPAEPTQSRASWGERATTWLCPSWQARSGSSSSSEASRRRAEPSASAFHSRCEGRPNDSVSGTERACLSWTFPLGGWTRPAASKRSCVQCDRWVHIAGRSSRSRFGRTRCWSHRRCTRPRSG